MSQTCFYEVLGVDKTADEKAIKTGFRKKAMQFHPDQQVGKSDADKATAETKMRDVNRAYEVLSDSKKKAAYDNGGFAALERLENGDNGTPQSQRSSKFEDILARTPGMDNASTAKNPFFKATQGKPANTTTTTATPGAKTPEQLREERLAKMRAGVKAHDPFAKR